MNRESIVAAIRSQEALLKQVGVASLALVGSSARDARRDDSDVDVLIDVADAEAFSLMDRIGVMHLLADRLGMAVDVSRSDTLDPIVRDRMVKDAIRIF